MMVIYVIITPDGVHGARIEALIDEQKEARAFYDRLKPFLKDLSENITLVRQK